MKNITIDIVTQSDIRISIDGEKIANVQSFTLKVKDNEAQKYSFSKKVLQQSNDIPFIRSIADAADYFKKIDSHTAITQYAIRDLIKRGLISYTLDGVKKKVNVYEIAEYYRNGGSGKKTQKPKMKPIN